MKALYVLLFVSLAQHPPLTLAMVYGNQCYYESKETSPTRLTLRPTSHRWTTPTHGVTCDDRNACRERCHGNQCTYR